MQSVILPSRAALAQRIALQFSYGQNLIQVIGKNGLGKSYLLEHFVTDHYEQFNKAYVLLTPHTKDQQVINQLLEHSFSRPLIDESESLVSNYLRLVKEQGEPQCLWVIDNAKELSTELQQELLQLASHALGTLYILCATTQAVFVDQVVDIHLEPLNEQESVRLMQGFYPSLPLLEDPVFNAFIAQCQGNPALLLSWHNEQKATAAKPKAQYTPLLIAAAVLLLLVLAGAAYQILRPSAVLTQPVSTSKNKAVAPVETVLDVKKVEQQATKTPSAAEVLPALPPSPEVLEPKNNGVSNHEGLNNVASNAASNKTNNVASNKERTASKAIIAAKKNKPATNQASGEENQQESQSVAERAAAEQTVAEQIPTVTPSEPLVEPLAQTSERTLQTSEQAQFAAQLAPWENAHDHPWYLNQPNSHWVLQLAVVKQKNKAQNLIKKQNLQGEIRYYQHGEKNWYAVTYGNFGSLAALKAAQQQLEQQHPALSFYPKQIKVIKKQLQPKRATAAN